MRWLMEKAGGRSLTAFTLYEHHPIDWHYPYAKMQKASAFSAIGLAWRFWLAQGRPVDHSQRQQGNE